MVQATFLRLSLNHEAVLAVLHDSREEAKSIKEIAQAMGLGCLGRMKEAAGSGIIPNWKK